MAGQAESIIGRIFEAAKKDKRARPVVGALRDAFARGEWKQAELAAIVEEATIKLAKERE